MRFSGKMHVCAFVPASATVGDAAAAIKCDVMRSLRGRFTMHCDSLVGDETSGGSNAAAAESDGGAAKDLYSAPVVHEPPRRVMIQLPYCGAAGVSVSDYLFPGETPYDSNDSVEEILGFKPPIEAFDDEIEMVAGPIQSRETLVSKSHVRRRRIPSFLYVCT